MTLALRWGFRTSTTIRTMRLRLREIISKCQAAGVPTLIHHQTVELTTKWLQEGARFVLYSSDARSMHNAYRDEFGAIKAAGAELGGGMAEDVGESEEVI